MGGNCPCTLQPLVRPGGSSDFRGEHNGRASVRIAPKNAQPLVKAGSSEALGTG